MLEKSDNERTMLTSTQIEKAALDLFEAEKTKRQIDLLSNRHPGLTLDESYAIQDALVDLKLKDGRKQIGWKIGLTSRAMQMALKIETPDSGVIFDDMYYPNGSRIPQGTFFEPRIEAELAFIMGRDLASSDLNRDGIIEATEHIAPALEILETRVVRYNPKTRTYRNVCDTIADNAANAGIVLADNRFCLEDIDPRWIGGIIKRNGTVEETGLGAGILDDPITSVLWLARRLAEYDKFIRKGDIIMAGSFIRPIEAPSGSDFFADFGPFGTVECYFE